MERTLTTHLDLELGGPAKLVLAIAVAQGTPVREESLVVTAASSAWSARPENSLAAVGPRVSDSQ